MKSLIIGLGNPIIGDDAIGCICAQEIERTIDKSVPVEVDQFYRGGISLMERIIGYDRVLIINSTIGSGNGIGSVSTLGINDLPSKNTSSAHDASLKDAIEFGKSLGEYLPETIKIVTVGIEAKFEFSEKLSNEVAQSIPIVVDLAIRWLKEEDIFTNNAYEKHSVIMK